jgi:hypothetical protein
MGAHIKNGGKLTGCILWVQQDAGLGEDRLEFFAGGQDPSAAIQNHAALGRNFHNGLLLFGAGRGIVIVFEILQIKAPCGKRQKDGYEQAKQDDWDASIFHRILHVTGDSISILA